MTLERLLKKDTYVVAEPLRHTRRTSSTPRGPHPPRLVCAVFSIIFLISAGLFPTSVLAQVVITEIMYNLQSGSDSGREWIEVYNNGVAPVKLADLRLFENNTNHKIVAKGDSMLSPNAYAVIASSPDKFKTDWPQFSGQLFDSAFSLSNDGETISIRNASSTVLDTATYTLSDGAAGDGNSLNKSPGSSGAFVAKSPTPGSPMSDTVISPPPAPAPVQKIVQTKPSTSTKTAATKKSRHSTAAKVDATSVDTAPAQDQLAAAAIPSSESPYKWWFAVGALALSSVGAIVFARKYARNEWDIVEEV